MKLPAFDVELLSREILRTLEALPPDIRQHWLECVNNSHRAMAEDLVGGMWGGLTAIYQILGQSNDPAACDAARTSLLAMAAAMARLPRGAKPL